MNNPPLETERKFLIKYPDTALLASIGGTLVKEITQTYLLCDTGSLRVRKTTCEGATVYHRNEKRHVTDITSEEYEKEISEEAYTELLRCADMSRKPIEKTRYAIPFDGHIVEVDVYPFWSDRAVMEIELLSEDEAYTVPECIEIIKEVTADKRYSNRALSKQIITEEL